PQVRIDPKILRSLAPPGPIQPPSPPVAQPQPQPPAPTPAPQPAIAKPTAPVAPQPVSPPDNPIRPPEQQTASNGLVLPRFSPGKALQENLHEALKDGGTTGTQFSGPVRPSPNAGGGGIPGGGGGGQAYTGGSLQLLTPTEGVDFSSYLERMRAIVQRNWY